MAKFTVSVTVTVLLFLSTFSDAHLQLYPNDNDVTKPETDADPTLLLPSEKPESVADVKIEAIDVSDLVNLPLSEEPTTTTTTTFVKFRPINRHFGVRRQFPLRYMRRHPCRHHHHHHKNPVSAARSDEISYGDDMIFDPRSSKISYGDDVTLDRDPEVLFRDHVIPSMSLRFQEEGGVHHHHHHHHRSHDKFMPKYVFAKEKLKRPFRREEEEEEILKEKKQEEERENGGFVKGIRKFLNHF